VDDLETLLRTSDYVSLHLPGGPTVIGAAELAHMRPGAVLINTARGSAVDTAALVHALRTGRIGGAALDVLEPEPIPADHDLLALDNVIVTPHSAAFSEQALTALRTQALDNIIAVLSGGSPITPTPEED
jgi:phosphoglycerate dehydrogenase-like enzyme